MFVLSRNAAWSPQRIKTHRTTTACLTIDIFTTITIAVFFVYLFFRLSVSWLSPCILMRFDFLFLEQISYEGASEKINWNCTLTDILIQIYLPKLDTLNTKAQNIFFRRLMCSQYHSKCGNKLFLFRSLRW